MRTFLLALVIALAVIGISGHADAACPTPNPNNSPGTPPSVHLSDNCTVPAATLDTLFNGTATQANITSAVTPLVAQVANNTALAAMSGSTQTVVQRLGFSTAGDGPVTTYAWNASACSNADNGAQTSASGGGCWIAQFQSDQVDPRVWGATCSGSVDSTAAFQAANSYLVRNHGGAILVSCTYTITGGNVSLGNNVHLHGVGPLYFPVQTGLSLSDGNPTTSNTWPPTTGPAINCTSTANPCLVLAGSGNEIDNINFGNPEPVPPSSGTYTPTAYPYIIGSVLNSGWQGAYLHDLTCTSCYSFIDFEGQSSYSSSNLFSGTQDRIQHIWCDPCMKVGLRLHDIDNPLLVEGWEFTPTGWYFDAGPLGVFLRQTALGFDINYAAAPQFHDIDFFTQKQAIRLTNSSVTNNFGVNTFALSGAQFTNIMFNQVCQGIAFANELTTVVAPKVSFDNVQIWGDQSGNQCSKGVPFFALGSNNFNISMSHVGVWDIDTLASVGCGVAGTGSCPSDAGSFFNAILDLDDVDVVAYGEWTASAPFISCVNGAQVGLGTSNIPSIRPAASAGNLFGPGLDGSQCYMSALTVGGGTNGLEGSAALTGGTSNSGTSGFVNFYLPNGTKGGYVGGATSLGVQLASPNGNVYVKPNQGTSGESIFTFGNDASKHSLLNTGTMPTAAPSGTGLEYVCIDNANNLYIKSSCP